MRLKVENAAGRSEISFIPASAIRDAQLELNGAEGTPGYGFATAVYCAWWAWSREKWTTAETWEQFADGHSVEVAPSADPLESSA